MPTLDKYSLDKYALDNFTLDKHKLDANVLDGLASGYTPDLCVGGNAYAESEFAGLPASNAVDDNTNTEWCTVSKSSPDNVWWAYKFTTAKKIVRIKIISSLYPALNFKNFSIQGSNDSTDGSNGTWTTLASGLNTSPSSQWDTFDFINNNAYQWIRYYGPAQFYNSGVYYIRFTETEMMALL